MTFFLIVFNYIITGILGRCITVIHILGCLGFLLKVVVVFVKSLSFIDLTKKLLYFIMLHINIFSSPTEVILGTVFVQIWTHSYELSVKRRRPWHHSRGRKIHSANVFQHFIIIIIINSTVGVHVNAFRSKMKAANKIPSLSPLCSYIQDFSLSNYHWLLNHLQNLAESSACHDSSRKDRNMPKDLKKALSYLIMHPVFKCQRVLRP